jgi:putative ABC transport system substrate-binding protein
MRRSLPHPFRIYPAITGLDPGVDPVVTGLVPSLAHPGGNATGFTLMHSELSAKRLELLRTAVPNIHAVAVFFYAANPGREFYLKPVEDAARQIGLPISSLIDPDSEDALAALKPDVFPAWMLFSYSRMPYSGIPAAKSLRLLLPHGFPALYPERE